mmetsp:Transcript_17381/g.25910  ORF Transcript_17381/g.25910 Transcript_17381/m.25910 type:complete len:375 (-) Transcript_17381:195-1319(-)
MFVKKDLRKIPTILAEAAEAARILECPPSSSTDDNNDNDNDNNESKKRKHENLSLLTELRLSRRAPEFKDGTLSILCSPANVPSLRHLESLSLYDCGLHSLDGIGLLASPVGAPDDDEEEEQLLRKGKHGKEMVNVCCPNLREINVGRNPLLTTLPSMEIPLFGKYITSLWLDDCSLSGPLPECIVSLEKLEVLRLSYNKITKLPSGKKKGLHRMKHLKVLCLDGNEIEDLPEEMAKMKSLETLLLRQNQIKTLPEGLPGPDLLNLSLLHVSSNKLTSLPDSITQCTSLCTLYVNGNAITSLPMNGWKNMKKLKTFNVGSNNLDALPDEFVERFGEPDLKTGDCTKDETCTVRVDQNPVVEKARQVSKERKNAE